MENPNILARNDRVIFSIDIRRFLYAGKVKQALLEYINSPMGELEKNDIEISIFENGRTILRPEDIISRDIHAICSYTFTPDTPHCLTVDLTDEVNKALYCGNGYISFRLRNITTEKLGNTKNAAEGIYVKQNSVRLLVKD